MEDKNVPRNKLQVASVGGMAVPSFAEKKFHNIRFPTEDIVITDSVLKAIEMELPVIAEFRDTKMKGAELLDELAAINAENKSRALALGKAFRKQKAVWTDGTKIRRHKTYTRREMFRVDVFQRIKDAFDKGGRDALILEVRALCQLHEDTINEMKKHSHVTEILNRGDLQKLELGAGEDNTIT